MAGRAELSGGTRSSAGLLLYRIGATGVEVLLGHMGGPFWARRDAGAWTIPKGEYGSDEAPLAAAKREFVEELGMPVPLGRLVPLGNVRQAGGKQVTAWAMLAEIDPDAIVPGTFTLEWPPKSGVLREFPELDRVRWMPVDEAIRLIVRAQAAFLDRLVTSLNDCGAVADSGLGSSLTSNPGPGSGAAGRNDETAG